MEEWFGILDEETGELKRDKGDTRPYMRKLASTVQEKVDSLNDKCLRGGVYRIVTIVIDYREWDGTKRINPFVPAGEKDGT